jgi:hypothetical protein
MATPPKKTTKDKAEYSKLEQAEEGSALVVVQLDDEAREGGPEPVATATPVRKKPVKKKKVQPLAIAQGREHPPPFGLPEGGKWGTNTYHGSKTTCTSAGCCIVCGGISACIVCCFPFDKRRAYMVDGNVYDANGSYIGGSDKFDDEEFDGNENKVQKQNALMIAGAVGTILTILYLVVRLSADSQTDGGYSSYSYHSNNQYGGH